MSYRVLQWTSGGVARQAMRLIESHPDLTCVGMYAYSSDKVGRDAGELVGLPAMGVTASNDIQMLIDLKPDVVSYSPLYPDIDHLVQLLEAGINVVTTCNFLTGWGLDFRPEKYGPNARQRLQNAAVKGGASLFGTGINPGQINYLACVVTGVCESFSHLRVTESVNNIVPFLGDPNIAEFGYGKALDTPGLQARQKAESAVFGDAIELMADILEIPLEAIQFSSDLAPANTDIETPGGLIKQGMIAGVRLRWQGISGGKPVLENQQIWFCGDKTDGVENWRSSSAHGYTVDITGNPNIHNLMLPYPSADAKSMTLAQRQAFGMRITAAPSINAIPAVCAAAPGIVTYRHLPAIGAGKRLQNA